MNRGKILEAWRKKRAAGAPIHGGPEGPDFVTVSHLDPLNRHVPDVKIRAAVRLLPWQDSNALALAQAKEGVGRFGGIPVLADVCATDPLRMMDKFLQELRGLGVAAVRNFPSVGLIDGSFRKTLEDTGLGYAKEVAMIGIAAKLDLLTVASAYSPVDAQKMAEAGADVVVAQPGHAGAKDAMKLTADIAAAARSVRKGILVFGVDVGPDGLDGIQSE